MSIPNHQRAAGKEVSAFVCFAIDGGELTERHFAMIFTTSNFLMPKIKTGIELGE